MQNVMLLRLIPAIPPICSLPVILPLLKQLLICVSRFVFPQIPPMNEFAVISPVFRQPEIVPVLYPQIPPTYIPPSVLPLMSAEFQQFSMVPLLYPHIAPVLSALPILMFPFSMPRFLIMPEEHPKSP